MCWLQAAQRQQRLSQGLGQGALDSGAVNDVMGATHGWSDIVLIPIAALPCCYRPCSLRTTLCVRFKGSVVACGIIFYTARKLQVPLPDDWWELFLVKLEDMCEVCRVLHELYL